MPEFDKTKKAIGLNKLDDSARKQMFNKFVEAGGQVLKEKPDPEPEDPKKPRTAPKVRQGNISRTEFEDGDRGSGDRRNRGGGKDSKDDSSSKSDPLAAYEREISSFTARLAIKFKCWFGKVTPFGRNEVNPSFMHEIASSLKQALMECHYTTNELLSNSNFSPQIAHTLDAVNPLLIELIAKAGKLYNGPEINQLCEPILKAPETPVPLEVLRNPLYSLFKKLYILYPYHETLKKAMNQAYDALQKLENKPALIYSTKKKNIQKEIDTIFEDFFEKLYLLIIRSENKNIPLVSRYMENLLAIEPEDRLGQRKPGGDIPGSNPEAGKEEPESKESKTEETGEEENEEKKEEKPPLTKEQAYGLRLMQVYSIPQLRKKFDPKNDLSFIPDNDKALLAYFYFREFDEEYSIVMTTKKIVIKPVQINGVKVDYRQKMQDIYEGTRVIADQYRAYLEVMRELKKHKDNPGANYIEASKKLTGIEQKRTGASRTVRIAIKDLANKSKDALLDLIKDMKTKKEIVGNMEDALVLEAMEAKKRLNKKAVKQAIMDSYCYTLALFDRLESGDLYGGLSELTPEQMKESFGIEPPPPAKLDTEEEKNSGEEQASLPKPESSTQETSLSEDEEQDLGDLS